MSAVRTALRGIGQLLISVGLVLLLFVVYELYWTNLYTNHEQSVLRTELRHSWSAPQPGVQLVDVALGDALAILRIPRLGRDYVRVIVEGVGYEQLKKGPGHYPGTALPGQIGNFVVSGHRTTWGAPFNRLDEVRKGDAIVVETRNAWYTYRVDRVEIVQPDDVAVIAPVPDHPGLVPKVAAITLTTCNPEYSATQRLVVHGILVDTLRKPTTQLPPALSGQAGP